MRPVRTSSCPVPAPKLWGVRRAGRSLWRGHLAPLGSAEHGTRLSRGRSVSRSQRHGAGGSRPRRTRGSGAGGGGSSGRGSPGGNHAGGRPRAGRVSGGTLRPPQARGGEARERRGAPAAAPHWALGGRRLAWARFPWGWHLRGQPGAVSVPRLGSVCRSIRSSWTVGHARPVSCIPFGGPVWDLPPSALVLEASIRLELLVPRRAAAPGSRSPRPVGGGAELC